MKSYIYLAAIAASISVVSSCSENEVENAPVSNVRVEKTFGVSTPSSSTRAYIYGFHRDAHNTSQSVEWAETDEITVLAKGHEVGDKFSFDKYGNLYNHADFTGKTYEATDYFVLYPYQPSAKLTAEEKIQFTIPAVQQATKGSFDPAAAIYIGHVQSSTAEIGLKTAVSYLSFHANTSVSKVQMITKQQGWNLSGTVIANPKSGGAVINDFVQGQGSPSVSLDNIQEEGDYLLAFIPSTKFPEFSVVVWAGEGVYEYQFSSSKTNFLAGNIYELGTLGTNDHPVTPPYQEE